MHQVLKGAITLEKVEQVEMPRVPVAAVIFPVREDEQE